MLGAAILAAVGVGFYKTTEEAVGKIVSVANETLPTPKNLEVYSKLHRLYGEAYEKLKGTSKEIASFQEA